MISFLGISDLKAQCDPIVNALVAEAQANNWPYIFGCKTGSGDTQKPINWNTVGSFSPFQTNFVIQKSGTYKITFGGNADFDNVYKLRLKFNDQIAANQPLTQSTQSKTKVLLSVDDQPIAVTVNLLAQKGGRVDFSAFLVIEKTD